MMLEDFAKEILEESRSTQLFSLKQQLALHWLVRQTHTRTNHARMMIGEEEGAFLRLFAERALSERVLQEAENANKAGKLENTGERNARRGAFRILEIGTFTGYSLLCLASAAQKISEKFGLRCTVHAIEINDELKYLIEEGLERAGLQDFATVTFADAKEVLRNFQPGWFDLVFIDADKREYPTYLGLVLPLVKSGGYILADNVLWYGKTLSGKTDPKTQGIISFNHLIENLPGCTSYLLPIRDGLYIIRMA